MLRVVQAFRPATYLVTNLHLRLDGLLVATCIVRDGSQVLYRVFLSISSSSTCFPRSAWSVGRSVHHASRTQLRPFGTSCLPSATEKQKKMKNATDQDIASQHGTLHHTLLMSQRRPSGAAADREATQAPSNSRFIATFRSFADGDQSVWCTCNGSDRPFSLPTEVRGAGGGRHERKWRRAF